MEFKKRAIFDLRVVLYALVLVLGSCFLLFVANLITDFSSAYSFYFTEGLREYKLYFPIFYFPLFVISRLLKIGVPILLISCGVWFLVNLYRRSFNLFVINISVDSLLNKCILFLGSTFVFEIIFYFLMRRVLHPSFYDQLLFTRSFLLSLLGLFFIILISNLKLVSLSVKDFFLKPSLPYTITIFRIFYFGYLIFIYILFYFRYSSYLELFPQKNLPFIGLLMDVLPISSSIYQVCCIIGCVVSFFICIGYKTRLFLIINSILVFYIVATPNFFGKLWHNQIIIWISWIMAFSDCYDIWSIDNLNKTGAIYKKTFYGFPLRIIYMHFGLIYFFAGFYKLWLCGWDWALTNSMVNQVYLEWFENHNLVPSIRVDDIPYFLNISGVIVIYFEIIYLLLMFNFRTRIVAAILGYMMHRAIEYLMFINFFVVLVFFYFVFLPWNYFFRKIKKLNYTPILEKSSMGSLKIWIPLLILFLNFLCGVFNINSYPFSIYPVYASIVPETTKNFSFVLRDKKFKNFHIQEEARIRKIDWESLARFETPVVEKYYTLKNLDTSVVYFHWQFWQHNIPELRDVDSVDVYFVHLYLQPEKMRDTISSDLILKICKGK